MEFFINIGQWFVNNKVNIIAFLTSGEFVGLLLLLYKTVKQHKSIKFNTESTNALNESIKNNDVIVNDLSKINLSISSLNSLVNDMCEKVNYIESSYNKTVEDVSIKLTSMLDVQSLVYSTIRDDELRDNVQNVIATAKLAESNTKAQLQNTINDLKAEVVSLTSKLESAMNDAEEKVNTTINVISKDEVVKRY